MPTFELILLLAAAVLVSSVADQLIPRVSLPLIQIGMGLIVGLFATTTIDVTLDPEFFLLLFIAPLLFNDAKHADKLGLWKNRFTILSLAIGLVVVIMLCVGFSVNWLIPSIPLTAAFALGAALGPTDAVAVTSLSKSAQLNRRESAWLSGEALLNDASGVVSFQFAIAAAVTGAFSLVDASVTFVLSFFGGIIAGLLLALAAHWLQNKIRDMGLESSTFFVLFDVSLPFIIYLLSEVVHVSGILAVVAAGLLLSSFSERRVGPAASRLNIVSSSVWSVLTFTLNGIVFVLLGMQLPRATQSTWDDVTINNWLLIFYVLALIVFIVGVRFLWVLVIQHARRDADGVRPKIDREMLRSAAVTTFGGPKGAVTLSIIFSIPLYMDNGGMFPQRNLIIFLASGVILGTLVLANFLLPLLAPAAEEDDFNTDEDAAEVKVDVLRRVIERLTAQMNDDNEIATNSVIRSYNQRIASVQDSADIESASSVQLRVDLSEQMQSHIIDLVEDGEIDEYDGYRFVRNLDKGIGILQHRSTARRSFRRFTGNITKTLNLAKRIIVNLTPGVSESDRSEQIRDMHIRVEQFAIDWLQKAIDADDSHYPTEILAQVMLQHQAALRALEEERPSVTTFTRTSEILDEVEATAYRFELEEIQDLYDGEKISRAFAKHMRDNVYLMQLDLENHV